MRLHQIRSERKKRHAQETSNYNKATIQRLAETLALPFAAALILYAACVLLDAFAIARQYASAQEVSLSVYAQASAKAKPVAQIRILFTAASPTPCKTEQYEVYSYTQETAKSFHADMTIYACGLVLGMNAGVLNMTEPAIAKQFYAESIAMTAVYGAPSKENGETKKWNLY